MTQQERQQLKWRERQERFRAKKVAKSAQATDRIERMMSLACPKRKRNAA